MFIKLVIFSILFVVTVFGKQLSVDIKEEKKLSEYGIEILDIASITYGYLENSKEKSTVILGKFVIPKSNKNLQIYDPWEEMYARDEHRKINKIIFDNKPIYAIIVVTHSRVNILAERSNGNELRSKYPFKIKIKYPEKLQEYYPRDKEMLGKYFILIPGDYGTYDGLYWNGQKYLFVWASTNEGEDQSKPLIIHR